jgi:glutathione S-transferase
MVLKLYGWPKSTCTQRVAMVLHEKKVPFEFIMVDLFKGESKTPQYLKHQPFGQVPYIVRAPILVLLAVLLARLYPFRLVHLAHLHSVSLSKYLNLN